MAFAYTESQHGATAVTCSESGAFVAPNSRDLITLMANRFVLFSYVGGRLLQRYECVLHGSVTAARRLRLPGASVDALVMLFGETHVSVVVYDARTFSLRTVSLHLLPCEQEVNSEAPSLPPLLLVEPTNSMIAVLSQRRYLFVLPVLAASGAEAPGAAGSGGLLRATGPVAVGSFLGAPKGGDEAWGDEDDYATEEASAAPSLSAVQAASTGAAAAAAATSTITATTTATIDDEEDAENTEFARIGFVGPAARVDFVGDLKEPIRGVRDIVFLHGAAEPTVMVLREKESIWAGRVKLRLESGALLTRMLVCGATCLTLPVIPQFDALGNALPPKVSPLPVWSLEGLPYNAMHLFPIPGGAAGGDVGSGRRMLGGSVVGSATVASDEGAAGSITGALCLCTNSVVHLTRSGTCFGAYFNNHGLEEAQSDSASTIQWCAATWSGRQPAHPKTVSFPSGCIWSLSATEHLLSTSTGDVLVLTFSCDLRHVYQVDATLACVAPPATAMVAVAPGPVVFLASRLGDSLLLHYHSAANVRVVASLLNVGPIADADTVDCSTPDAANPSAGAQTDAGVPTTPAAAAAAAAFLFGDSVATPVSAPLPVKERLGASELVACVGQGRCGALAVLSRHVRTVVALQRPIDAVGVFSIGTPTLQGRAASKRRRDNGDASGGETAQTGGSDAGGSGDSSSSESCAFTRLMLLSNTTATIVLAIGETLAQLPTDKTALCTTQRTVFAASVAVPIAAGAEHRDEEGLDGPAATCDVAELVVQVAEASVVVVPFDRPGSLSSGSEIVSRLPLPAGVGTPRCAALTATGCRLTASGAQVLVVLTTTGALLGAVVDGRSGVTRLDLCAEGVSAFCVSPEDDSVFLFSSVSGDLSVRRIMTARIEVSDPAPVAAVAPAAIALEGDADADVATQLLLAAAVPAPPPQCFRVTFTAPRFPVVSAFSLLPTFVRPSGLFRTLRPVKPGEATTNTISEAALVRLRQGPSLDDEHLTLFLLTGAGELVAYQVHAPPGPRGTTATSSTTASGCGPTFVKVYHDLHDTPRSVVTVETIEAKRRRREQGATVVGDTTEAVARTTMRLIPFANLGGGISGMYACGRVPKVFVSSRGVLRAHPHWTATPIRSMAPVHSRLIDRGFCCCGEGAVTFGSLYGRGTYDFRQQWPTRKIALGVTPHFVAYLPTQRSCVVVTSKPTPYRPVRAAFDIELDVRAAGDPSGSAPGGAGGAGGETIRVETRQQQHRPIGLDEGIPIPMANRYSLSLFHTPTWSETDSLLLDENEVVLCMQALPLSRHNSDTVVNAGGALASRIITKESTLVVAVGSGFPLGEDVPCRGQLRLVDVRQRRLDGSGGESKRVIHTIHCENFKGPITAVASLSAHLVITVGATVKVMYYDWADEKLITSCIYYAGTYIVRIATFKNYCVFGDLYQSVSLARFREDGHVMATLAKDPSKGATSTVDVLFGVDGIVSLVSVDESGNVLLFGYEPRTDGDGKLAESNLSLEADVRLSGPTQKLMRLRIPNAARNDWTDTTALAYFTAHGEIGVIQPTTEPEARVLKWLAAKVSTEVPQPCGLNPRTFRAASRGAAATLLPSKSRVLDGNVYRQFLQLAASDRRAVASVAATQVDRVVPILAGLAADARFF